MGPPLLLLLLPPPPLFSPSSSLLFLIFINKTFPFLLHLFTLFWIFPSLPLFLSLDLCIFLLIPFCHIFYLCLYSFSFLFFSFLFFSCLVLSCLVLSVCLSVCLFVDLSVC